MRCLGFDILRTISGLEKRGTNAIPANGFSLPIRNRSLICKRPEFPSGMRLGARPSMRSWVLRKKRDLYGLVAGGERFLRSGGLRS